MNIIERHAGCDNSLGKAFCWGPSGPYYTVFNSEIRFLTKHIIISVVIGLILFGILFGLKKKDKIKTPLYFITIISIIVTIAIFFLSVYLFPVMVNY